jgi:hypothetical protein
MEAEPARKRGRPSAKAHASDDGGRGDSGAKVGKAGGSGAGGGGGGGDGDGGTGGGGSSGGGGSRSGGSGVKGGGGASLRERFIQLLQQSTTPVSGAVLHARCLAFGSRWRGIDWPLSCRACACSVRVPPPRMCVDCPCRNSARACGDCVPSALAPPRLPTHARSHARIRAFQKQTRRSRPRSGTTWGPW